MPSNKQSSSIDSCNNLLLSIHCLGRNIINQLMQCIGHFQGKDFEWSTSITGVRSIPSLSAMWWQNPLPKDTAGCFLLMAQPWDELGDLWHSGGQKGEGSIHQSQRPQGVWTSKCPPISSSSSSSPSPSSCHHVPHSGEASKMEPSYLPLALIPLLVLEAQLCSKLSVPCHFLFDKGAFAWPLGHKPMFKISFLCSVMALSNLQKQHTKVGWMPC